MTSPKASVVIPTFNAGPNLKDLLGKLSSQETDFDYEVLVIDSGSTDGTVGLARRHGAFVHQIPPSEFDHGATRNLGISLAGGEYVVLTVQDALPLDGSWLSSMVENLELDDSVAGVYGRQIPNPDSDELTRALVTGWPTAATTRREQFVGEPARYRTLPSIERRKLATFDNVSSCIRRSVWEELPFARTSFGEDLRWGKKVVEAGYKLVYEPRSAVFHSHERGTLYDLRRHYVDQLVLLDLFGPDLAPKLRHLPANVLRHVAYLCLRLVRTGKPSRVSSRLVLEAAKYAAVSQVGAYLAVEGKRLSRVSPGLYARLDRFLKKGG